MSNTFDEVRGKVWGLPGWQKRKSAVVETMPIVGTTTTYVVETTRTDDGFMVFLQTIDATGSLRLVVPSKVVGALYRHYDSIVKATRRTVAKEAAQKRKEAGVVPFQKKQAPMRSIPAGPGSGQA